MLNQLQWQARTYTPKDAPDKSIPYEICDLSSLYEAQFDTEFNGYIQVFVTLYKWPRTYEVKFEWHDLSEETQDYDYTQDGDGDGFIGRSRARYGKLPKVSHQEFDAHPGYMDAIYNDIKQAIMS